MAKRRSQATRQPRCLYTAIYIVIESVDLRFFEAILSNLEMISLDSISYPSPLRPRLPRVQDVNHRDRGELAFGDEVIPLFAAGAPGVSWSWASSLPSFS